jgi:hypothetical protein
VPEDFSDDVEAIREYATAVGLLIAIRGRDRE